MLTQDCLQTKAESDAEVAQGAPEMRQVFKQPTTTVPQDAVGVDSQLRVGEMTKTTKRGG